MAGVKGRSGGPRPNSGGARPGAGRPPKPKAEPVAYAGRDPLEFLLDVMEGKYQPTEMQLRAALAAVQYEHPKAATGKKPAAQAKAAEKSAPGSRFAPRLPAHLRLIDGPAKG